MLPVLGTHLIVSDADFAAFIERHASVGPCMSVEDNQDMLSSYIMVDPQGRFFQNAADRTGTYIYSRPITADNVAQAFRSIPFSATAFAARYRAPGNPRRSPTGHGQTPNDAIPTLSETREREKAPVGADRALYRPRRARRAHRPPAPSSRRLDSARNFLGQRIMATRSSRLKESSLSRMPIFILAKTRSGRSCTPNIATVFSQRRRGQHGLLSAGLGLEPFAGFVDASEDGTTALIYDLVEPLRPILDRVVARMLRHELATGHFHIEDGACRFVDGRRGVLNRAWEAQFDAHLHWRGRPRPIEGSLLFSSGRSPVQISFYSAVGRN